MSLGDEDYTEEVFEEHPEESDFRDAGKAHEDHASEILGTSRRTTESGTDKGGGVGAEDAKHHHLPASQQESQRSAHGGMHVIIEQAVAQVKKIIPFFENEFLQKSCV
jgi:hypothetical protein